MKAKTTNNNNKRQKQNLQQNAPVNLYKVFNNVPTDVLGTVPVVCT